MIIAFGNQKGGVGKTSATANTGQNLADIGYKVLMIDLDPNGTLSVVFYDPNDFSHRKTHLTVTNVLADRTLDPSMAIFPAKQKGEFVENLYIMPADISLAVFQSTLSGKLHKEKYLKKQLDKIHEFADIILIDLPATLCDLCLNGAYAADFLVVLASYDCDALKGIKDLFSLISEAKESQEFDYKILRNEKDERLLDAIDYLDTQLNDFQDKLFKTIIRKDQKINRAKMQNQTVFSYDKNTRAVEDYKDFSQEIKDIYESAKKA